VLTFYIIVLDEELIHVAQSNTRTGKTFMFVVLFLLFLKQY